MVLTLAAFCGLAKHSTHATVQKLQACYRGLSLLSNAAAKMMTINMGDCLQISPSVLESDYPMPVKPRKGIPFVDEEEEEEVYCAAPFNMNADIEATPYAEPGEEQGEQQVVAVSIHEITLGPGLSAVAPPHRSQVVTATYVGASVCGRQPLFVQGCMTAQSPLAMAMHIISASVAMAHGSTAMCRF